MGLFLQLQNHLDLDTHSQRELAHGERGAGMAPVFTENFAHKVRRPVNYQMAIRKCINGIYITRNANHPLNAVEGTELFTHHAQNISGAKSRCGGRLFDGDLGRNLSDTGELVSVERNLPRCVKDVACDG